MCCDSDGPAPDRLRQMVLALHRRKRERFEGDPEVYQLYRRVLEERPELVGNYASAMTHLLCRILADGVRRGDYVIDDVEAAASVVRDAVTVFVHPGHVEAAIRAGAVLEPAIDRVMETLNVAFRSGIRFNK